MKRNKENEDLPVFSWEEFEKEKALERLRREEVEKDKYEWDRPLVDETWQLEERKPNPPVSPKTGFTQNLPTEEAIVNAALEGDLDLSAFISEKLKSVAEAPKVNETAIRSSVDKKIVIKSEELKGKRAGQKSKETKRKVRRRIPKDSESGTDSKELYEKEKSKRRTEKDLEDKKALSKSDTKRKKHGKGRQEEPADKMSAFRKDAMNWKDQPNEAEDLSDAVTASVHSVRKWGGLQWLAVVLAVVVVGTAAMTTAVYASYRCECNRARALETLKELSREEVQESADTEEVVADTEEIDTEYTEVVQEVRTLSLVLTSVEKDLKIKLVDQDDTLVRGVAWGVTVTDEEGRTSDNDDDDRDGIIYLTDMSAGDYSVDLKPSDSLSEFVLPTSGQMVSVKAKVEYKVIANIKDEIKSEKEVNAAVEDNGNKAADVETGSLKDTVEWVESTKTASGEAYEESQVELTLTRAARAVQTGLFAAIEKLSNSISSSYNTVLGMPVFLSAEVGTSDTKLAAEEPEAEPTAEPTPEPTAEPTAEPTPEPTAEPTPEPTPVPEAKDPILSSIQIDKSTLKVGETATLSVSGQNLDGYTITYTASSGCVTISGNTVTAVKEGKADITAKVKGTDESITVSGLVTVSAADKKVTEITVALAANSIVKGKTTTATATVSPSGATNKAVTWSSSDVTVATVDANGTVTGVAEGKAKIVATAADGSGVTGSAKVTVTDSAIAVTKVVLKPTELTVAVKSNYQISLGIEPSNATDKTVKWTVEDKTIATVSDGGLVTGVKVGSTKVTATAKDGSGKSATCVVTVTEEGNYKDTDQLYDKDNNKLYKLVDGEYVLAKYKDYKNNKSIKLYKKGQGYLYTGWQTINGKTYYYKKDNTYVTGDQVIGGVVYHFATDGALSKGSGTLGIDVSKYQPSINWSSVKGSGVNFVIIRCGYRGSSTGVLVQDPYFVSHIKGAKAAGLKVGVYFFTTALTESEAIEEASMCAYLCGGYGIDYPVFIDVESNNRAGFNSMSAAQRTQIIQAFCNTLKSAGYTPGVYANNTWLTEKINASSLSGYKIWLAQYNASGATYNGRYDLWQYTSKGSVAGISGNVDMNQSYLGY